MRQTDETTMMLTTIANLASLALERHNAVLELTDEVVNLRPGFSPTDTPAKQECCETKDRLTALQELAEASEKLDANPSGAVNGIMGAVQAVKTMPPLTAVPSSLKQKEEPKAAVVSRKRKTKETAPEAPKFDAPTPDSFGDVAETNLEDILG